MNEKQSEAEKVLEARNTLKELAEIAREKKHCREIDELITTLRDIQGIAHQAIRQLSA